MLAIDELDEIYDRKQDHAIDKHRKACEKDPAFVALHAVLATVLDALGVVTAKYDAKLRTKLNRIDEWYEDQQNEEEGLWLMDQAIDLLEDHNAK